MCLSLVGWHAPKGPSKDLLKCQWEAAVIGLSSAGVNNPIVLLATFTQFVFTFLLGSKLRRTFSAETGLQTTYT